MSIGENIKKARQKKGLTQAELGKKLNVSASMIGAWEKGIRHPKVGTISKIADALETEDYEILDLSPHTVNYETLLNTHVNAVYKFHDLRPKIEELFQVDEERNHIIESLAWREIAESFHKLNKEGKVEASNRVEELTQIEKYTKKDED